MAEDARRAEARGTRRGRGREGGAQVRGRGLREAVRGQGDRRGPRRRRRRGERRGRRSQAEAPRALGRRRWRIGRRQARLAAAGHRPEGERGEGRSGRGRRAHLRDRGDEDGERDHRPGGRNSGGARRGRGRLDLDRRHDRRHQVALFPLRLTAGRGWTDPMSVRHLTLAFAVLALLPATASAAEIYPSVSPTVLRGDGPWSITYKIEVDAGPAPERLLLSVDGSQTY